MARLFSLPLVAVLLGVSTTGIAATPCTLVRFGVDQATIDTSAGRMTYRLEISSTAWELDSFGWHAQAILGCKTCTLGQVHGGTMRMSVEPDAVRLPTRRQDEASVLITGSTWFGAGVGVEGVQFVDEMEGERQGMKVIARRFARRDGKGPFDHVALTVTDGCLAVQFYLQAAAKARQPLQEALQPLLDGLELHRTPAP